MNKLKLGGLFFGVLLLGTSPALADFYTYDVNQSIAGGSATGWIETNGIGSITETGQIYDWVLTLSDGSNNEVLLGPQQIGTNSTAFVSGTGLTATATTLTFDFSVTDSSELLFSDPDPTSLEYLSCSGGPPSGCNSAGLYLAVAAPAVYESKRLKKSSAQLQRLCRPPSRSSPPASVQWAFSAGARSGRRRQSRWTPSERDSWGGPTEPEPPV